MKLIPDDPRLTALALNELSGEDARQVREAIKQSPDLEAEFRETSALAELLGDVLGPAEHQLGQARREEIFKAGSRPDTEVIVVKHRRETRSHTLKVALGAAAAVVLGFFALRQVSVNTPSQANGIVAGDGSGDLPGTGEGPGEILEKLIAAPALPQVSLNGDLGTIPLDFSASPVDLKAVEQWVAQKQGALPQELSNSLTWVNHSPPRSVPDLTIDDLSLSAEMGPCHWDPSRSLLLLTLQSSRPSDGTPHDLVGFLELESDRVVSATPVGRGAREASKSFQLPAGSHRHLFFELELLPGDSRLGAWHLDTRALADDPRSAYLPIQDRNESPSLTFQVATVLAEFAKASGDQADLVRRVREIYPSLTDAGAREAFDMIFLAHELSH